MFDIILKWNHMCLEIYVLGDFKLWTQIFLWLESPSDSPFNFVWVSEVYGFWGIDPFLLSCQIYECGLVSSILLLSFLMAIGSIVISSISFLIMAFFFVSSPRILSVLLEIWLISQFSRLIIGLCLEMFPGLSHCSCSLIFPIKILHP